ncbi:MAG TPA: hypothetical protein VMI31_15470 [Fimbriimonadaceae bacterium]|nr:hypothetical protein [Fimbriimonadaceae bacterium]
MGAAYYIVLIEVHLRTAEYVKGQRLTVAEMDANAFTLLHFGFVRPESEVVAPQLAA